MLFSRDLLAWLYTNLFPNTYKVNQLNIWNALVTRIGWRPSPPDEPVVFTIVLIYIWVDWGMRGRTHGHFALAGTEPGPSDSQSNALTTLQRHETRWIYITLFLKTDIFRNWSENPIFSKKGMFTRKFLINRYVLLITGAIIYVWLYDTKQLLHKLPFSFAFCFRRVCKHTVTLC